MRNEKCIFIWKKISLSKRNFIFPHVHRLDFSFNSEFQMVPIDQTKTRNLIELKRLDDCKI